MINIRPLISQDYGAFAFLREKALDDFPSAFLSSNKEDQALRKQMFVDIITDKFDFHMGAIHEDILVGITVFTIEKRLKRRHIGNITSVFVLEKYQKLGIGRSLLIKAMGKAAEIDTLEKINLSVSSSNHHALKLYQSLGFEIYGEEKNALKIGEQRFDETYMAYHF